MSTSSIHFGTMVVEHAQSETMKELIENVFTFGHSSQSSLATCRAAMVLDATLIDIPSISLVLAQH